jgi:hypothetical protein
MGYSGGNADEPTLFGAAIRAYRMAQEADAKPLADAEEALARLRKNLGKRN